MGTKEFKGTKGQWSPNVISGVTIGVNAEILKTEIGMYSQNVCEFILPDTDEEYEIQRIETEANAQLIASAPQLLKALQFFADEFPNFLDKTNIGGSFYSAREIKFMNESLIKAHKAIKSALGE